MKYGILPQRVIKVVPAFGAMRTMNDEQTYVIPFVDESRQIDKPMNVVLFRNNPFHLEQINLIESVMADEKYRKMANQLLYRYVMVYDLKLAQPVMVNGVERTKLTRLLFDLTFCTIDDEDPSGIVSILCANECGIIYDVNVNLKRKVMSIVSEYVYYAHKLETTLGRINALGQEASQEVRDDLHTKKRSYYEKCEQLMENIEDVLPDFFNALDTDATAKERVFLENWQQKTDE
jgi:hypothetical protein